MTTLSETVTNIKADVALVRSTYGTYLYVIHPGTVAILIYRVAHYLKGKGPIGATLSRMLCLMNIVVTGADFHADAKIGPGLFVPHPQGTMFGETVTAGKNLKLFGGVQLGAGQHGGFPQIGDNVSFWAKSSAFGLVHIGDNVQVGAHALVMCDVPADHIAVGVPAKVRLPKSAPAA